VPTTDRSAPVILTELWRSFPNGSDAITGLGTQLRTWPLKQFYLLYPDLLHDFEIFHTVRGKSAKPQASRIVIRK
jgi:hypothetical protein